MRLPRFDRTSLRAFAALAIAQLIAWGAVQLLAVVGARIAADLHLTIATVFAGNSVFYVAMGLWAPVLAGPFGRLGARRIMAAGACVAAAGFVVLGRASGPVPYFMGWAILGSAGSAMLTTAGYIALNEIAGRSAGRAIAALMLITGLSSSIFWPLTAVLSDLVGWRGTCFLYAAAMLFICAPLYAFGLPSFAASPAAAAAPAPAAPAPTASRGTFYLIIAAIALNAFVTFGLSAILIELLKAEGLSPSGAVAFASLLGVIQVGARAVDFLGDGRWDAVTAALFAGAALPVAMLVLIIGGGAPWSVAIFFVLYGLGGGVLAVARGTIPLVFYDKDAYARAASYLALPLNIASALSPPVLAGLLTHAGGSAVLGFTAMCSSVALLMLILLSRRRPAAAA